MHKEYILLNGFRKANKGFAAGFHVPLMFRCRNVSKHAFARLFTSDLIANDCRVYDWLGALSKNDEKHLCLLVMLTMSTTVIDSHLTS